MPTIRHGMGPHFGTRDAAETRLEQLHADSGDDEADPDCEDLQPMVVTAYLRITKPALLRDVHFDEVISLDQEMVRAGMLDAATAGTLAELVAILRSQEFDGIVYPNIIEGDGAFSWIPFDLDQIWEVSQIPL